MNSQWQLTEVKMYVYRSSWYKRLYLRLPKWLRRWLPDGRYEVVCKVEDPVVPGQQGWLVLSEHPTQRGFLQAEYIADFEEDGDGRPQAD